MIKKPLVRLLNRFGFVSKGVANEMAQGAVRSYAMAQVNRLTADWVMPISSDANREIRPSIKIMRERSRDMSRNEDYIANYFRLLKNNVLGAFGIGLEMKIAENYQAKDGAVSKLDTVANQIIETCWNRWGRREFCTLAKDLSWLDVQNITLESTARDGAILHKEHYTGQFGYCLQPIEADQLDTEYNLPLRDGREIRLGVQYSATNEVEGYWVLTRHPGSLLYGGVTYQARQFIPATEMLHIYNPTRVQQGTGVPWIHTVGIRAKNLAGYEEAAVIDARVSAAKGIWLKRTTPVQYEGAATADGGQRQMEVQPGTVEELPPGTEPFVFTPNNPNADAPAFIKSQLRGMSSGLGVSYTSLANDLEGVNYSSIRAGLLEEREEWKSIQTWYIGWFIQPVFESWLKMSLARGAIRSDDGKIVLPASKFDKFNKPEWKPRRWDWVDPLKDIQASVLAIEKGLDSRRNIIAQAGGDVETVDADQAADKQSAKDNGLDYAPASKVEAKAPKGTEPPAPDPNEG